MTCETARCGTSDVFQRARRSTTAVYSCWSVLDGGAMHQASNLFFEHPILNSPYAHPARYWELDDQGQPTQRIIESRRRAEFITPIPKPRKRPGSAAQRQFVFDEGKGLSTQAQQYDPTSIINELRRHVSGGAYRIQTTGRLHPKLPICSSIGGITSSATSVHSFAR
jgi:hypothetical protein